MYQICPENKEDFLSKNCHYFWIQVKAGKKKKCMSDIKKLPQGKEWIHVISYRKINEGFGLAQEMKFSITDKKAHEGFL